MISLQLRSIVSMQHIQSCSKRLITSGNYTAPALLNYIDGKRCDVVEKTTSIPIIEPATGKDIGVLNESSELDVNMAVKKAKEAQKEWSKITANERGKLMIEAARNLKKVQEEIARVEVSDTGKPIWEARLDVQTAVDSLQYYGGLAANLSGQYFQLQNNSFGYSIREPLGVVVGIGAWNYPIQMAGWKSAPALACGNAVIFKPSQFTPLTAVMLAEVFTRSGLPPNCYSVVQGGHVCGDLLTKHEGVAKVTFTGSVNTGTKVMRNCADGIKHVTLELGGKSPLIIFDDCDVTNAVNGAMMANYLTQGQVCSNGTRVFVQDTIYDEFVEKLVEKTSSIKHGDPQLEETLQGSIIHKEQGAIIQGFLERAKKEGAKVLCGGGYVKMPGSLSGGCYWKPCVLEAADSMEISRDEVFGPIMNVYKFNSEQEVVERANNSELGLASGLFTKDLLRAHRVAGKLEAGNCYINNFNIYPTELPFGGNKKSGLGRENGVEALNQFSQLKTVYVEAEPVWCPFE